MNNRSDSKKRKILKKGQAIGSNLLREWINDAHHAEKLASSKDLYAIKSFVEKIGTNHHLLDKKVLIQWKNPGPADRKR
jgi:hypothetical protein